MDIPPTRPEAGAPVPEPTEPVVPVEATPVAPVAAGPAMAVSDTEVITTEPTGLDPVVLLIIGLVVGLVAGLIIGYLIGHSQSPPPATGALAPFLAVIARG